jgi:hypothetical protein
MSPAGPHAKSAISWPNTRSTSTGVEEPDDDGLEVAGLAVPLRAEAHLEPAVQEVHGWPDDAERAGRY